MANEGSLSNISTPSPAEHYLDLWYAEGNEIIEAGGPSSIEVQPDLTDSPRSISQSSHLEDFESASPSDRLADNRVAEDLDIMGIANTWFVKNPTTTKHNSLRLGPVASPETCTLVLSSGII